MSDPLRVATLDEIPVGGGIAIDREVTGTDDDIALVRDPQGRVWAINDTCTHETASLAEGWVEDDKVECPLHGSTFCLRTGKVLSLPATRDTKVHRVEVVDGQVLLYPDQSP